METKEELKKELINWILSKYPYAVREYLDRSANKEVELRNLLNFLGEFSENYWGKPSNKRIFEPLNDIFSTHVPGNHIDFGNPHFYVLALSFVPKVKILIFGPPGTGKTDFSELMSGDILYCSTPMSKSHFYAPNLTEGIERISLNPPIPSELTVRGNGAPLSLDEISALEKGDRSLLLQTLDGIITTKEGFELEVRDPYQPLYITTNSTRIPAAALSRSIAVLFPGYSLETQYQIAMKNKLRRAIEDSLEELRKNYQDMLDISYKRLQKVAIGDSKSLKEVSHFILKFDDVSSILSNQERKLVENLSENGNLIDKGFLKDYGMKITRRISEILGRVHKYTVFKAATDELGYRLEKPFYLPWAYIGLGIIENVERKGLGYKTVEEMKRAIGEIRNILDGIDIEGARWPIYFGNIVKVFTPLGYDGISFATYVIAHSYSLSKHLISYSIRDKRDLETLIGEVTSNTLKVYRSCLSERMG